MEPTSADELELRDYLRVLRRRAWIVVLTTVLVVGAALTVSLLQTPVYRATAELLLQPRSTESLFDPTTGQRVDPNRNVQTEIQVLQSRPVQDAVREELGEVPPVSASPVGQTDVVRVSAEHTDPEQAAVIANTYAEAYIDFKRTTAVNDLLEAAGEVQAKIDDLQRRIESLDARVAEAPAREQEAVAASVAAEKQSLQSQQALFRQKLDQLQVDSALKTGGAQLVTPAVEPSSPVRPTPLRNGVVALVVGLILGVGLAFLRDYLDDSIKGKEDVDAVVGGLPVLGLIPAIPGWKDRKQELTVSETDPKSPAAEAYRTLRTSIQFMGLDRPVRTVQVTSPSSAEGKTTTLANLAVALARAGQRVVVVDCDLRRPRIHKFFALDNERGFTSVLLGDASLSAVVQQAPGEDNLFLIGSGPIPPNPSELLSSRRAVEVLTSLQAQFDMVLIDCPPVLPVTDAAVLSHRVDATLLVATAGRTTQKDLARAVELLAQVEAPLIGAVLNAVKGDGRYSYSYRYAYAYAYAQEPEPKGRRGRRKAGAHAG